ncbi:MAG TPA: tRNA pseudouridine(55) synthase TruB [Polyangiaceae bacterium]|nr:tRNA pseudouridine(55) synthase TruB [Polyangiaceae bacterium]
MRATPSGVLVVDKPRGPTSHDVVARVRRALHTRDVGHAGTLDPMATGVLVVAVGEATKLVPWLTSHSKTYEATIALGVETDSLDADGRETRRVPPSDALRAALAESRGPHLAPAVRAALEVERARKTQVPPAFSAIHTEGERAHERARRGEEVELAPRVVTVHRLDLVASSEEPPFVAVALDVSKGYYVRSLARDLSAALGTVGHLTALRRVRSGCFVSEEALPLDTPDDELAARVEPLARVAARALPVARLTVTGARDARHGRRIKPADIDAPTREPCAWLDEAGALVAVGELDAEGTGQVLRGFGGRE